MRNPYLYIEDILNSIKKIKRYTADMSFRDFVRDEKTIDAVLRNLEVIGEAAKNVPKEIQQKYPQIPWKEIAGIHAYFGVDLEIVWHTITSDLPKLESELSKIIKREG